MRKTFIVMLVSMLALSVILSGCSSTGTSGESKFLRIGSASMGGNFFPLASAIAQVINEKVDGYNASAQATGGSAENANFLGSKEVELALIQSGTLREAYEGLKGFEGRKIENIRGITAIYFNQFHVLVRNDSKVEKIEDLKGKKIAVGPVGGGIEINTNQLLAPHGITPEDYEAVYGTREEATEWLKTGRVDAHIYGTGLGSSQITELMRTGNIKLLPVDEKIIDKIVKESPDFGKGLIPAGTYENQDTALPTIVGSSLFVAREDLSEELVYNITKAIFDNLETLEGFHQYFKQTKPETATGGMAVPLHPGAEKYLKEIGAIK